MKMTKSLLSRNDLEHAALLQIRSCYGCEDVTGVIIDEIADPRFETNWTILSLRRTDDVQLRLTAELHTIRAIDGTQERLRKLYNLRVN
jgi:hypothetical protein